MKLLISFLVFCHCFISCFGLADNAKSAILIDGDTNEVLFEKNCDEKMYPASTTKIMTLILIYEALNNQKIQLNEIVTVSSHAANMGGSQVFLEEGEKMCVEDLLKSIILASANDACVAFAEYLEGTQEDFVDVMNQKAKKLGLENTHFMNCTGLHDDNHYTCASDLAIMAKYLITIGGDNLYKYTKLKEDYIRNDEFWLINTNKLLSKADYITGLKTGFTRKAGYCLVTTAFKDSKHLISVLLNEEKSQVRNQEAFDLINYGYSLYKTETLFNSNDIICTIYLPLTKEKNIDIKTNNDIVVSMKKDENEEIKYDIKEIHQGEFKEGDHVANLIYKNQIYPLYASTNATTLTFMERVKEVFMTFV